ncbi:MAG: hypothetical protein HQL90_04140 [Magnetococcales bacterium]|nr:hypothetical protein [Magnetococcales bacterium]
MARSKFSFFPVGYEDKPLSLSREQLIEESSRMRLEAERKRLGIKDPQSNPKPVAVESKPIEPEPVRRMKESSLVTEVMDCAIHGKTLFDGYTAVKLVRGGIRFTCRMCRREKDRKRYDKIRKRRTLYENRDAIR